MSHFVRVVLHTLTAHGGLTFSPHHHHYPLHSLRMNAADWPRLHRIAVDRDYLDTDDDIFNP